MSRYDPDGVDLAVDEAFEQGSETFVHLLRNSQRDVYLAALAPRWLADPRPWARQAMLAYLDEPFDRPGHNALVKRLFKAAEASSDLECMTRFLARFDQSIRLRPARKTSWDYEGRRMVVDEVLRIPDDALYPHRVPPPPPGCRAMGSRHSRRWNPRTGSLFSPQTRRYLRRRAWRFFRQLGHRDPLAYRAAIALALRQYPAHAVQNGPDLLQSWGLVHALFYDSELLERGREHVRLRPGRKISELEPAPAFAEVWQRADAVEPLLDLLCEGRCGVVVTWAHKLLATHHASTLATLPLGKLLALLGSDAAGAREIGVDLLRRSERCSAWTVDEWMQLLAVEDAVALGAAAERFREFVRADRVDHELVIRLLTEPSTVVVDLGLELARTKDWSAHRDALLGLARATCEVRERDVAQFALSHLELGGERYHRDRLLPFFDSLARGAREAAWAWLEDHPRAQDDAVLWARLCETPYPELRQRLVPALERHLAARSGSEGHLSRLWTTVLLDVQRGSRTKGHALRQLTAALVDEPARAGELLPAAAVAVRSIRGPEREAGLHALLTAFARRPELRPAIARALPELELPEAPPCW